MSDRLIFHIDVNSAFVSWSAVEQLQNGGPDLRKIPSIVGGDPNSRTGIVAAKSIPAKKYGINTGEPVSMALRKCPNL
ncbi:MAG: DNA polymerase IV, partial [Pseudobutyrivibrio sp.]|nr:DNA polymerase IV [Pseudobutyrivibrio sp.]